MRSNVSIPFQYFTLTHLPSSKANSRITRTSSNPPTNYCVYFFNKKVQYHIIILLFVFYQGRVCSIEITVK